MSAVRNGSEGEMRSTGLKKSSEALGVPSPISVENGFFQPFFLQQLCGHFRPFASGEGILAVKFRKKKE